MEKTTFDFGYGPVPAHQHANGGGWVAETAYVADTAFVGSEARVYDEAQVCDKALVCDNAQVCDNARVCGEAWVYGEARVCDKARVTTTPLVISGLEYAVTVCDNQVQIGCKTVPATTQLSADLLPDETCPVLRACAHTLIPLIQAHYARVQAEARHD